MHHYIVVQVTIQTIPGAKLFRRELFREMRRALREYEIGEHENLWQAAWAIRDHTRRNGRPVPKKAIGRTLLIKGLEFDHVVLLNADDFDKENLYVALTRGSRSLTVLSRQPYLDPKK